MMDTQRISTFFSFQNNYIGDHQCAATSHLIIGEASVFPLPKQHILTLFSEPTYSPLKTSNVKHRTFICDTKPLVMRDTFKMFFFLILKDIKSFHATSMKIKHLKLNIAIQSQSYFKLKAQHES